MGSEPGKAEGSAVAIADREDHPGVKNHVEVLAAGLRRDAGGYKLLLGVAEIRKVSKQRTNVARRVADAEIADRRRLNPRPSEPRPGSQTRLRTPQTILEECRRALDDLLRRAVSDWSHVTIFQGFRFHAKAALQPPATTRSVQTQNGRGL